ncbi:hypothetical protein MKEN_01106500 [Mycena kentingensis (nom. inval.)]|nr:hypothetical protein MKEN_01106500 [Mycena kentingensis (nom. inval.)]
MNTLPSELIDHTIDFLHSDPFSLRACSLVCWSWVPAARFHTFEHVALRRRWRRMLQTQYDAFLALLAAPKCTFPAFVTQLTLQDIDSRRDARLGEEFHAVYPVLRSRLAETLRSVTFCRWEALGTQPLHEFLPFCTGLTELRLESVRFNSAEELFRMLSLCQPTLETLEIWWSTWSSNAEVEAKTEIARPDFPAALSVKTLRLRRCNFGDILEHFVLASQRMESVLECATLDLIGVVPEHVPEIGKFVERTGTSLRHLTIEFSGDVPDDWMAQEDASRTQFHDSAASFLNHVDLRKNPRLQSLSVLNIARATSDATESLPRTFLPALLRTLTPLRELAKLRFSLDLNSRGDFHASALFDWPAVDNALTAIDSLTSVEVEVAGVEPAAVYASLPRIVARSPGCLSVVSAAVGYYY